MELPQLILAAIGALVVLVAGISLLLTIVHYTAYSFSYKRFKGDWAVVTGASAGIGEAFALKLAKRGLNVALLARSRDKLEKVASACGEYGVKTLVLPFDFAAGDSATAIADWQSLTAELQELSPTVLVNNVGVNVDFPTELVDMSQDDVDRIVRVNVNATNRMTKLLLPHMQSVRRGIILCLSSGGGALSPAPLLAPYAGTKAYNDAFALALNGETRAQGVFVHSLTPFFVESAMAKMRASLTVPKADAFAEAALRLVGSGPRIQPYWVHHVMASALRLAPLQVQVDQVAALHRSIRKRALRKKERLAKQAVAEVGSVGAQG